MLFNVKAQAKKRIYQGSRSTLIAVGTYEEMLRAARAATPQLSLDEAHKFWEAKSAVFVDIREPDEIAMGIIPGSEIVHQIEIMSTPGSFFPDKDAQLVIYCAHGNRSAFAALALLDLGYTNVWSLSDGIVGWAHVGLPIQE